MHKPEASRKGSYILHGGVGRNLFQANVATQVLHQVMHSISMNSFHYTPSLQL